MGKDYWAYNIEDSAPMIEAMMKFAYQLGITPKNLDYESLPMPKRQHCRDYNLHPG